MVGVDVDDEDGCVVVVAVVEADFGLWRGIAEGARGVLDGKMAAQKRGITLLSATWMMMVVKHSWALWFTKTLVMNNNPTRAEVR